MVIALSIVAVAMIAAGATAIYDGYDIIVMEKGSAKVIAGTVAVSAGFVLLGIAAALAQLKRIGTALTKLGEHAASLDGAPPASPTAAGGLQPVSAEALAAGASGAVALEPSGSLSAPVADKAEPSRDDTQGAVASKPTEGRTAPDPAAAQERAGRGEADRAASALAETERPAPSEDLAAPPTVVGTYSSGGNTYVMYSDGSIQAETPTGLFRFDSLDELKAFIAAGGESVPPAR